MYWSTWLVGEVAQVLPEPGSTHIRRFQCVALGVWELTLRVKALAGLGLHPFAVQQGSLMEE